MTHQALMQTPDLIHPRTVFVVYLPSCPLELVIHFLRVMLTYLRRLDGRVFGFTSLYFILQVEDKKKDHQSYKSNEFFILQLFGKKVTHMFCYLGVHGLTFITPSCILCYLIL